VKEVERGRCAAPGGRERDSPARRTGTCRTIRAYRRATLRQPVMVDGCDRHSAHSPPPSSKSRRPTARRRRRMSQMSLLQDSPTGAQLAEPSAEPDSEYPAAPRLDHSYGSCGPRAPQTIARLADSIRSREPGTWHRGGNRRESRAPGGNHELRAGIQLARRFQLIVTLVPEPAGAMRTSSARPAITASPTPSGSRSGTSPSAAAKPWS
jgi:hypothetical protein